MSSESQQWEKWERIRSKGRKHFIWGYGVCGFGLISGCVGAVICTIALAKNGHPAPWVGLLIAPLVPTVGYARGHIVWELTEARYLAARATLEQKAAIEALSREVQGLRKELGR